MGHPSLLQLSTAPQSQSTGDLKHYMVRDRLGFGYVAPEVFSLKVVIVDSYYPRFLKSLALPKDHYANRMQALIAAQFGTSDFYSFNLKALGHEAWDLIVNDGDLQDLWWKQNDHRISKWTPGALARRLLLPVEESKLVAQILSYEPDVAYFQDLNLLGPRSLKLLKQSCLVVGQIACPLPDWRQLDPLDLILSSFPHYVERFRARGIASEYFKIGFEPRVRDSMPQAERDLGVTFVGGYSGHHREGIRVFEDLARSVPVDFWGYGVESLEADSPIRKTYHGEAWARQMYGVFSRSQITLNRHIDVAEDCANNMRLFEATGMGALLVTDHKKNIGDLFKVDEEIITFSSAGELREKVLHYLKNPHEAEAIRRRGQQRTLTEHCYPRRMSELVSILERYL